MADTDFEGLGVALVTPFKEDYSVDFCALENLIDYIIEGGCDYIVALGTTAETPTLTSEEKKEITSFIKSKVAARVPLVIGIGGNNTKSVIEDISSRDLRGYSAILSVTPYYNKPTQEGLFQHYKTIVENSPLPIILYNVPGRTGVNLSSETTLRLANFSSDICGIKEASGNFEQCLKILNNSPKSFKLISGDDGAISKLMEIGASGVISVLANALPHTVKNLVEECKHKNFESAHIQQHDLDSLLKELFIEGNPSGIKALLSSRKMIKNTLRLPLVPVSNTVRQNLEKEASSLWVYND